MCARIAGVSFLHCIVWSTRAPIAVVSSGVARVLAKVSRHVCSFCFVLRMRLCATHASNHWCSLMEFVDLVQSSFVCGGFCRSCSIMGFVVRMWFVEGAQSVLVFD